MPTVPYGTCHCGCGRTTSIAKENSTRWGHVRGEPVSYITGHVRRKSGLDYVVEDCGYGTPCWTWQLALGDKGYGSAWDGQRVRAAHIVLYERHRGVVPLGRELDHLCRNRACVNPDHLEPVTHTENIRRGRACRLTVDLAASVRARVAAGERVSVLAAELGVHPSTLYRVVSGKRWAG